MIIQNSRLTLTFCLFFLCVSCPFWSLAQGLKGLVQDEDQLPIIGAQIINLTNNQHTHTDLEGKFVLQQITVGDTIQVAYLGYKTYETAVEDLEGVLTVRLEETTLMLKEIKITPRVDALNLLADLDIQLRPVNSSQELLRQVPGLFIGQHAGGGKAEQLFVRGFDIDHGTDVSIAVDGIPVNMVSHAHGQGYADLHFIIPETLEKINFGKGPYYAEEGNFNTAAQVNFTTKKQLDHSLLRLEAGQFNSYRLLGMFNLLNQRKHQLYAAASYHSTDGPFDSPQNFHRLNLMAKYTGKLSSSDNVSLMLSHFDSKWDASGQIPERAVEAGLISRFGAIDDTEGGHTSRTNAQLQHKKVLGPRAYLKNQVYYSRYTFDLFSNFTFFLNDSIRGDQIRQQELRHLIGGRSTYQHHSTWGTTDIYWQAGFNWRNDQSLGNELARTQNRSEIVERLQSGDINETNLGAFAQAKIEVGKWVFNPSVRVDYFDFQYNDALQTTYETQSLNEAIVSPKLNILFQPSRQLQLYLKGGKGFHSNDTRLVLAQTGSSSLPAAYGADLGFLWKPSPKLLLNAAYWYLYSEQEFVYVGDEGIVEPSGQTQRHGGEVSVRYQPLSWLFGHLDVTYTHARALEEAEGENFIPLAPDLTLTAGIAVQHPIGIHGGVYLRWLNDRPANEDYSIVAKGYAIVDLNVGYHWKHFGIGIQIQNLLNTDWNETQFATNSRLANEPTAVEEIHFTPGSPFWLRGSIEYRF